MSGSAHEPQALSRVELGEERLEEARALVQRCALWAMGVGLVPIPVVDIVGLVGIQLEMIGELSRRYGVPFSEHAGKNVLTALLTGAGALPLGRILLQSLLKLIPGVGSAAGLLTVPIVAGATVHATGAVFIMHFESGGTLLDFDPNAMRRHFARELQSARARLRLDASAPAGDDLSKIEGIGPKLSTILRNAGITSFRRLAATEPARLKRILLDASLPIPDPTTWPEQAALAADGRWAELKSLQEGLNAGRRRAARPPRP
ncbi:MAG: DUF4332 domain-containing protein [Myxococcales bacterium]|nr:DUF4332 domain-containing protein [Myxococcales bacterium]